MSHEITTRPLPIVNPYPEEFYYYIPLLDRQEWDGIEYDSIEYSWQELDYRFDAPYPSVPESSTIGLTIGLILFTYVAFKNYLNK
jgi:hypothetical protein